MPRSEPSVSSLDSFIVRIYRIDPVDDRGLVGIVELVDGSGEREAFCDTEELGSILHRHTRSSRLAGQRADRSPHGKANSSGEMNRFPLD